MFTDEQKKIINVYINGKEIQFKRVGSKEWITKKEGGLKIVSFDFELFEYRIKPKMIYTVVSIRKDEYLHAIGRCFSCNTEKEAEIRASEEKQNPKTINCVIIKTEYPH